VAPGPNLFLTNQQTGLPTAVLFFRPPPPPPPPRAPPAPQGNRRGGGRTDLGHFGGACLTCRCLFDISWVIDFRDRRRLGEAGGLNAVVTAPRVVYSSDEDEILEFRARSAASAAQAAVAAAAGTARRLAQNAIGLFK
jgi:hypothetical protein